MNISSKTRANAHAIWYNLSLLIKNPYGIAAVLGNLYAESGLIQTNLQNSYERKLGMSDTEYTRAVDLGEYKDFATDGAGYGLAQWTYKSRKKNLEGMAKTMNVSIGYLYHQICFLMLELCNYSDVLKGLRDAKTIKEASDLMYYVYESPASSHDEKSSAADKRAEYSQYFYDEFKDVMASDKFQYECSVLSVGSKGDAVKKLQQNLITLGYDLGEKGADGSYGNATRNAVKKFQELCWIYADGKAGSVTQYLAEYLVTSKARTYTVTISKLTSAEAADLKVQYPDAFVEVNC